MKCGFFVSTNSKDINEEKINENIKIVNVPWFAIGCHPKFNWNILLKYQIEIVHIGGDNRIFVPRVSNFCDKNNIKTYFY